VRKPFPGLVLDEGAPQLDQLLAAPGRRAAGQLLAHHQRQGVFQRGVLPVANLGQVGAGIFVLQHRADIVGDAGHGARADRLDARLLQGVEHGTRLLALRRQPGMDAHVVAGAPERQGIADAAGDRHVVLRGLLRQFGQAGAAAGQRRLVLGEADLQLLVAGDGAHGDRQRTLEAVGFRA